MAYSVEESLELLEGLLESSMMFLPSGLFSNRYRAATSEVESARSYNLTSSMEPSMNSVPAEIEMVPLPMKIEESSGSTLGHSV